MRFIVPKASKQELVVTDSMLVSAAESLSEEREELTAAINEHSEAEQKLEAINATALALETMGYTDTFLTIYNRDGVLLSELGLVNVVSGSMEGMDEASKAEDAKKVKEGLDEAKTKAEGVRSNAAKRMVEAAITFLRKWFTTNEYLAKSIAKNTEKLSSMNEKEFAEMPATIFSDDQLQAVFGATAPVMALLKKVLEKGVAAYSKKEGSPSEVEFWKSIGWSNKISAIGITLGDHGITIDTAKPKATKTTYGEASWTKPFLTSASKEAQAALRWNRKELATIMKALDKAAVSAVTQNSGETDLPTLFKITGTAIRIAKRQSTLLSSAATQVDLAIRRAAGVSSKEAEPKKDDEAAKKDEAKK